MVSICRADHWLPEGPDDPEGVLGELRVSICRADHWLPEAWAVNEALGCAMFQSAAQITGSLKSSPACRRTRSRRSFNLPRRSLAP